MATATTEGKPPMKNTWQTWAAIIALAFTVTGGTWALATVIYNNRHEELARRTFALEAQAQAAAHSGTTRDIAIERLSTQYEAISKTLDEIRGDVKSLIANH